MNVICKNRSNILYALAHKLIMAFVRNYCSHFCRDALRCIACEPNRAVMKKQQQWQAAAATKIIKRL